MTMRSPPAAGAQVLYGYFAAIASLDPERIAACFRPDGELEDPIGTGVRPGRDEIREYWARGLCAGAVAVDINVLAALPAGRSVAGHWQMSARSRSGVIARAEGIDVLHLDEAGLIRRAEGYWDQMAFRAALMKQLDSPTS
jgi:ketosteroid isomerase-like protein